MERFVVLLRGINVGGKNKIAMADLKHVLEEAGFMGVSTYIQSGNLLLSSPLGADEVGARIEALLPNKFKLDGPIVRVVAFDQQTYRHIIQQAPPEFGFDAGGYRCNVLFLMNYSASEAMEQVETREGVDEVWQGERVLYFRNSMANASKSRLSKIVQRPFYQYVTIRNWNTAIKLLALLEGTEK